MRPLSYFHTLIFDLDGTLYDEQCYLFAAYRAISVHCAKHHGTPADDVAEYLISTFMLDGRRGLLDRLCDRFGLPEQALEQLLHILRSVDVPEGLPIEPPLVHLIEVALRGGQSVFVLTNGNPIQQRNKWRQLKPVPLVARLRLVCADEFAPKPSPAGINEILRIAGSRHAETLMTGNDDTDRQAAGLAGVPYFDVRDLVGCNLVDTDGATVQTTP